MEKFTEFDFAEYLDSDEAIAEYMSQVLEEGDTEEFYRAIGYIAKSRGMSDIAKETGLGRESLYKSFKPGSAPKFDTVVKVMGALGLSLHADVAAQHPAHA